jgi:hypothetical protein
MNTRFPMFILGDTESEATKSKRRGRSAIQAAKAITVVIIVLISGFFVYTTLFQGSQISQTLKAAIVDQLSIKFPNETFVQMTTSILANAGFAVDYYDSSKVTVEFWKNLPRYDYNLIVLRVHSITHEPGVADYTGFFTVEPWDNLRYAYEKATDQILAAAFIPYREGDPEYFAITSRFVTLSMIGRFNDTAIVMMGCSSLTYADMAEAIVGKGAKLCTGWDDMVTTTHTDYATTELLKYLITKKETIRQATTETNEEVGPDPDYNSTLVYFPTEAESYVIPTAEQSPASNPSSPVSEDNRESSFIALTSASVSTLSLFCVGILMKCWLNHLIDVENLFMPKLMVTDWEVSARKGTERKRRFSFRFLCS